MGIVVSVLVLLVMLVVLVVGLTQNKRRANESHSAAVRRLHEAQNSDSDGTPNSEERPSQVD